MTDHHHHRFGQLRSTSTILKETAVHFTARPFMFILLSLLLMSFRSLVESGSFLLNSFIDRDPSFKSLLTRLDLHPSHPHARLQSTRRHTRRPFLLLTRAATLEDDFLSSQDDFRHQSPFSSFSNRPLNGTPVILSNFDTKLGFSNFVADMGFYCRKLFGTVSNSRRFHLTPKKMKGDRKKGLWIFSWFIKDLNWGAMMQLCCSLLLAFFGLHMGG